MQFKVPQNIDMQDRVVGPLTLIQFLYLLVGGILIYFFFTTIAPVDPTLFLILSTPVFLLSFSLAFLKVQDQPFGRFVVAFVFFLFRPKSRRWHKAGQDPELIITPDKPKKAAAVAHKTIDKSQLEQLTQVLDTGGKMPADNRRSSSPEPEPTTPLNMLKKSRPLLDAVRKGS